MNLLLKTHFRAYCFLTLWSIVYILPGFFSLPVIDRDEARFSQASRQMLESKDFVRIHFQDQPRHKKPVGTYWFQSLSVALFSASHPQAIWAYRLPSFLGALLTILALYWGLYPVFGRRIAFLAGLFMASSILLAAEAKIAKTDALLTGFTTLSLMAVFRLYTRAVLPNASPNSKKQNLWTPFFEKLLFIKKIAFFRKKIKLDSSEKKEISPEIQALNMNSLSEKTSLSSYSLARIFWISLGVAVLVKGPIPIMVLVLTLLVLFSLSLQRNQYFSSSIQPLSALLDPIGFSLFLAILLPWSLAIGFATDWQFYTQAFMEDLAPKLVSGHEGHNAFFGFYFLSFWPLFWPASLFLIPGSLFIIHSFQKFYKEMRKTPLLESPKQKTGKATFQTMETGSFKTRRNKRFPEEPSRGFPPFLAGLFFLFAWFFPNWVAFELFPTKLVHYPLPLYPVLAVVSAFGIEFLVSKTVQIESDSKILKLPYIISLSETFSLLLFILISFALSILPFLAMLYGRVANTDLVLQGFYLKGVLYPLISFLTLLMIFMILLTLGYFLRKNWMKALVTALLMGLVWQITTFSLVAPKFKRFFISEQIHTFLEKKGLHFSPQEIYSPDFSEPSLVFRLGTKIKIGKVEQTLKEAFTGTHLIIVDALKAPDKSGLNTFEKLKKQASETQACLQKIGQVEGVNYARGDPVRLILLKADSTPCP